MHDAPSEERVTIDLSPADREHGTENGRASDLPEQNRASYNPATGELLGYVPLVGRDGIDAAIRAAREAQRLWATRSVQQRAGVLRGFQETLVSDMEAVARLISMEQGKPLIEAISLEILATLPQIKWLIAEGPKVLGGKRTSLAHPFFSAKRGHYLYEPLGVVAVITPWNYPFAIPITQILAALLAGNGVVFKPSPHTPLIAQKIADLLRQSGLPAGLLSVIHIEDGDGAYFTAHAGLNKILFTGSSDTGRKVMASAAQVPTPVVLELGGKDAALVAPDADLNRAVHGIVWHAMANSGQTCAAVERAYVHVEVYDRFVEEAVALVAQLKAGDGMRGQAEVGPLTDEQQLRTVETHVEEARARGARVLVGGHRLPGEGFFYAPTVLVDVTPDMRLMQEESFGPLLPIIKVESLEEAVAVANAAKYGLTASVWTRNEQLGLELAGRLRVGAVNINDHFFHFAEPAAAWGGVGESGFGRVNGPLGLMEMVNPKWVSTDLHGSTLEPWWYPYDEQGLHFLRNAVRLLYGPTARRPWALLSLLLNPRTWQRVNLLRFVAGFRKWL